MQIKEGEKSFFWAGKYHDNMNKRDTLVTDLNVLANFDPKLPESYQENLKNIGNGVVNKIYVSFDKPFWGNRKGYINFVTKTKTNRYPVAFIMSEKNRHILCFFVSANPCREISQWKDE